MGAALGVAAIAAQWLVAAGWAPPAAATVSIALGLIARVCSRRAHACVAGAPVSMSRTASAGVVLAGVVLCVIRSPIPVSGGAGQVLDLLGERGRTAAPVRVIGTVIEPARYRDGSATLLVRATSLNSDSLNRDALNRDALNRQTGPPLDGLVRVRIAHCGVRFVIGQRIALRATLRSLVNFGNPGEFDWASWNHRRGFAVSAFVWSDRDIVSLGADESAGFVVRLRARMSQYAASAGDRGAALVAAVTVGDRGGLDAPTLDAIRDAGMAHALAISGLHVGLLAGACLILVGRGLLETAYVRAGRDATIPACAAAFVAVLVYSLLGGGGVSVFRAVAMGCAALWVLALAGAGRPLEVLGLAAAGLAMASPGVATEPGFQLSFAATLGLVALAGRRPSGLVAFVSVPVLAWVVTAPIVAQHFQRVSLIAPLVNLLAAPLVSATVLLGLAGVALLAVAESVAHPVLSLAALAASALLKLCDLAAAVPWAARDVVSPGPILTLALSGVPIVLLLGGRWRRGLLTVTAVAIAILTRSAILERYHDDRLDLHFVSVGQGDATIVKLPGGKIAVVDGGGPGRGRLAVGPWLGRLHVRRIDYLVATHAQSDHWGGLAYLAEHFEIGEFWHSGGDCDVEPFVRFVEGLSARGVTVVDVGAVLSADHEPLVRQAVGGATITALAPRGTSGACDSNDRSVVISVRHRDRGVLLTGDIEAAGEGRLLEDEAWLRHIVIKVPHHGSRTSSTRPFLDAVEPWLAVAGCGADNRYGFPHEDVVARYRDAGSVFLSTDRYGAVSVRIDAAGIGVRTAKML